MTFRFSYLVLVLQRIGPEVLDMRNGFTLIELLIAVAVVAILGAIALPAYRDYVTRGKLAEAYTLLSSQRVKMEQYYQDVRDYTNACAANTVATPSTGTYFQAVCSNLGPNTYTITATPLAGSNLTGFSFTIDQNNNKTSVGPTGWGASNNCWIRAKGGQC
jgi:type IV pilus assembly protein PilE